jgi:hypothetical protein
MFIVNQFLKVLNMKELGREGLSRGLHFISGSAANGEGKGESDEVTAESTKPSYDDLVALSMKLTRQNKLMKTQFQKMQCRINELIPKELDYDILINFVKEDVGVDIAACKKAASVSEDENSNTIDPLQLKHLYHIKEALAKRSRSESGGDNSTRIEKSRYEVINLLDDDSVSLVASVRQDLMLSDKRQESHQSSGMQELEFKTHNFGAEKELRQIHTEDEYHNEMSDSIRTQLDEARTTIQNLVESHASKTKLLEEELEYMNAKYQILVQELDQACKRNKDMLKAESIMQNQQDILKQENSLLMERLEATNSHEKEMCQLLEENQKLQDRLRLDQLNHNEELNVKKEELANINEEREVFRLQLEAVRLSELDTSNKNQQMVKEIEILKRRNEESQTRLSQLTSDFSDISLEISELKKALSEKTAQAARLQTENIRIAASQAEQAAKIEASLREMSIVKESYLEAQSQILELETQLKQREKLFQHAESINDNLQVKIVELEQQFLLERKQLENEHKMILCQTTDTLQQEIERIENDSKMKSKLAREVMMEKEVEIERLSKLLQNLEDDVKSGDADNRKIFEVALIQAHRESEVRAQAQEINILNKQIEESNTRIQKLLEEKSHFNEEMTALMRTQRRNGVNMEYLKNVVVQYMSFRPGSSHQKRLVPVISTLLQFTNEDMKEIKKSMNLRSSSWGWGETKDFKIILPQGQATLGRENIAEPYHDEAMTSTSESERSSFHILDEFRPIVVGTNSQDSNPTMPPEQESSDL